MVTDPLAYARDPRIGAHPRLLLITLAQYANDEGVCWPGVRRLRTDTGLAADTIHGATEALTEAGRIEVSADAESRTSTDCNASPSLPRHRIVVVLSYTSGHPEQSREGLRPLLPATRRLPPAGDLLRWAVSRSRKPRETAQAASPCLARLALRNRNRNRTRPTTAGVGYRAATPAEEARIAGLLQRHADLLKDADRWEQHDQPTVTQLRSREAIAQRVNALVLDNLVEMGFDDLAERIATRLLASNALSPRQRPHLVDAYELAARLNVSRDTIYQHARGWAASASATALVDACGSTSIERSKHGHSLKQQGVAKA